MGSELINKNEQEWHMNVVEPFIVLYRVLSLKLIFKIGEPDNTDIMIDLAAKIKDDSEMIGIIKHFSKKLN